MSKTGNYRIAIQETDEYKKGFMASNSGFPRQAHAWMTPDQNKRYLMGWDDARNQEQSP